MKKTILLYIALAVFFIREIVLILSDGLTRVHVFTLIFLTIPILFHIYYMIQKNSENPEKTSND